MKIFRGGIAVGGNPNGVYATLSALQSAFPAGTSGIYVITADGNWYYWNGTAWTIGGIYQAIAVTDEVISERQRTDLELLPKPTNLFNTASPFLTNQYYDTNGAIVNLTNFNDCALIDVSAEDQLMIAFNKHPTLPYAIGGYTGAFFDASNNWLSSVIIATGTVPSKKYISKPTGAKYFSMVYSSRNIHADSSTIKIYGMSAVSFNDLFARTLKKMYGDISTERFSPLMFNAFPTNLFDINNSFTTDGYYDSTGTKVTSSSFNNSRLITASANETFIIAFQESSLAYGIAGYTISFFDSAKNWIGYKIAVPTSGVVEFTTPPNTAYISTLYSTNVAKADQTCINIFRKSEFVYSKVHKLIQTSNKPFAGKKGIALGDSITYGTGSSVTYAYPKYVEKVTGAKIDNYAVPGDNSGDLVYRVTGRDDYFVNSSNPYKPDGSVGFICPDFNDVDLVTIQIGENDNTTAILNANIQTELASLPQQWFCSIGDIATGDFFLYDGTPITSIDQYFALFPNTYVGHLAFCIEWILYRNKNCKIVLVPTNPGDRDEIAGSVAFSDKLFEISVALGKLYGVQVSDALHNSGVSYKTSAYLDPTTRAVTHPNADGSRLWGVYVGNYINNNCANMIDEHLI